MVTFELTPFAKTSLPPRILVAAWCAIRHSKLHQLAADIDYSPEKLSSFWRRRTPKLARAVERKTQIPLPPDAWGRPSPTNVHLPPYIAIKALSLNLQDLKVARDLWILLNSSTQQALAERVGIQKDSFQKMITGSDPRYEFSPEQLDRLLLELGIESSIQLNLF